VLGVARKTFEAFLHREAEAREAWDNGVLKGKASVRRAQFKLLEAGNATMAIWLGKQLLGQRDNIEHTGKDGAPLIPVINLTVGDERKAYSGGIHGSA
jgi:hypothetical protein